MKRSFILFILVFVILSCTEKPVEEKAVVEKSAVEINPDSIIQTYLKEGAWKYNYLNKEWGEWIDKGLEKDSTIAYLWQQRALPFWKKRKYEMALSYYDNAVKSMVRLVFISA